MMLWLQLILAGPVPAGLYLDSFQVSLHLASLPRTAYVQFVTEAGPAPGYKLIRQAPDTWTICGVDEAAWRQGLWGLLLYGYGLAFPHPKVRVSIQPLTFDTLLARPAFRWRGLHLHTQHPIELTEALLDPHFKGGIDRVYQFIDWLAQNGQNYFEFCLLRTIKLPDWFAHLKKITDYATARGVQVGIDLSLRMQQQYAFQL